LLPSDPESESISASARAAELASQARLRLLEELEASVRRYRNLVEQVPALVFHAGDDELIDFTNNVVMDILARKPEDVIGHRLSEFLHPTERKPLSFSPATADIEGVWAFAHADGHAVSLRVKAHRDEALGWTGVLTDQSRVQVLEGQLRQSQKMEALGSLAGGVAHDFNNILMGILGLADSLVQSLSEGDPRRADAMDVMKLAERGSAITHKLLQISRKREATPELVNLCQLSLTMRDVLRRLMPENIELHVQTPPHAVLVLADRTGLEQVLLNLVVNARDAMPFGGRVLVDVDRAEDSLVPTASLTVRDYGTGMPHAVVEHIFEPFFTTKGKSGTGLGLSVVYGIVQQAGGTISVESEEFRGTTFRILLPLVSAPAPEDPKPQSAALAKRTRHILLVEDDETLLRIMTHGLQRAGHTVTMATDAQSAFEKFGAKPSIDLIISDLNLGESSGMDLLTQLRAQNCKTPVLIVTGDGDDGTLVVPPVHAVLSKPLRIPELVEAVAAAPRGT
jgi:signal transduction histidine kinase